MPAAYQHRVLFWGVLSALILRGVMIGIGIAFVETFHWTLYLFGAFLLFTGTKMFFSLSTQFRRSLALRAIHSLSTRPMFAQSLVCVRCISCLLVSFTSLSISNLPWPSSSPLSAPRCSWLTSITSQPQFHLASLA